MPATTVRFLVFLIDSLAQAFLIPTDKRDKFATLLCSVLHSTWVTQKTLQCLAGKIISLSLALPVCKAYTREILSTISFLSKNNQHVVQVKPRLQQELSYWESPIVWQQRLPWRGERHTIVEVHTDPSKTGWGGGVHQGG